MGHRLSAQKMSNVGLNTVEMAKVATTGIGFVDILPIPELGPLPLTSTW
jgi:hypothetical protein